MKKIKLYRIIILLVITVLFAVGCDSNVDDGIKTAVPGAVKNLKAIAGDNQVVLSWEAPEEASDTQISYEVSKDNSWAAAENEFNHTFTALANGTEYTLKVRAVNENGAGAESLVKTMPSTNLTWTPAGNSKFNYDRVRGIAWNGTTYIAAGGSDSSCCISFSTDLITWTAVNHGLGAKTLEGISWIGGTDNKFYACGRDYTLTHSPDGVTWTKVADPGITENFINKVAGNDTTLIAAGARGLSRSIDKGVTWTPITTIPGLTPGQYDFRRVAFINNKFIAVGGSGRLVHSDDGITWINADVPSSNSIRDIVWANGKYVIVGEGGKIASSSDLINWTPATNNPFANNNILCIAFGNGKFFAGSQSYGVLAYSVDGDNWYTLVNNPFMDRINFIEFIDDKFIAGGNNGVIAYSN